MDQNSDINYYKINPLVLEYLKGSINDLENLIDNYRSNIKIIDKKKKDNLEIVESLLLNNLNNRNIISQLLGRLLRIISNNNLFNKNTNCSDLAHSLLFSFYSQEYNENIKKIIYLMILKKWV